MKASTVDLKPVKLSGTMAFMFETRFAQQPTEFAARLPTLQPEYAACWDGLDRNFDPARPEWTPA
jgi:homogentisate 1,2-dioxygenase